LPQEIRVCIQTLSSVRPQTIPTDGFEDWAKTRSLRQLFLACFGCDLSFPCLW
jgi:hypothetical protein